VTTQAAFTLSQLSRWNHPVGTFGAAAGTIITHDRKFCSQKKSKTKQNTEENRVL